MVMYDPKEVLKVCEKATPGPWDFDEEIWWENTPGEQERHGGLIVYPLASEDLTVAEANHCFDRKQGNANAQFIILARTALPEFAERVIELQEENAKLRAVAEAGRAFVETLNKCLSNEDTCNINECCFCEFDYEPKIRELRKALIAARYGGEE